MGTGTSVSRELRDRITGCLSPVIRLFTLHRRQPILHSSLSEGPIPHTTRGCNRRDERRERSYYHLHRNLNNPIPFHSRVIIIINP